MELTIIAGRLGRDADVRDVQGGRSVINFPVVTTEKYKDRNGEMKESTKWFDCAKWADGDKTGIAQYLKRGTSVIIHGKVDARAYKTDSGDAKASLTLTVERIELFGGSPSQSERPQNENRGGGHAPSDDNF